MVHTRCNLSNNHRNKKPSYRCAYKHRHHTYTGGYLQH